MSGTHPMMPAASHDETAQQLFVRDLKGYIARELDPAAAALAETADAGRGCNDRAGETYRVLFEKPAFRAFASVRRASQELLWTDVQASITRQSDDLDARAAEAPELGSLKLDPDFSAPGYLVDGDVHLMPGGYGRDDGGVAQGALMDRGGAVYMLGRNGGFLNDRRGHTAVAHLFARWPDGTPRDILELGCGIGASTVPMAQAFPEARVHGLDVGASMLRYALARARSLGVAVHFAQGSAEAAPYPAGSFDVVYSCVLLHETSPDAIDAIVAESLRLLRPGGIAIHLEVPQRYDELPLWGQIRGEIEHDFNNEPNWRSAISRDLAGTMAAAGFEDVASGYQDATSTPARGNDGFGDKSKGVFASWFVASGRKPA